MSIDKILSGILTIVLAFLFPQSVSAEDLNPYDLYFSPNGKYIQTLYKYSVIPAKYSSERIYAEKPLTRGEACQLMYDYINVKENGVQKMESTSDDSSAKEMTEEERQRIIQAKFKNNKTGEAANRYRINENGEIEYLNDAQTPETGQTDENTTINSNSEETEKDNMPEETSSDINKEEPGLPKIPLTDIAGNKYEAAIQSIYDKNLFTDDDGKIYPDAPISKGEFAALIYNYLKSINTIDLSKKTEFKELSNDANKEAIEVLAGNNILEFKNSKNEAKSDISKGEAAKTLVSFSGWAPDDIIPIKRDKKILDVPYVSQLYPVYAPIGCEPTSTYMALKYKGYVNDVNLKQFLDNMPHDSIDPRKGFVGSYSGYKNKTKRETIFPEPLAEYAGKYGKAEAVTGATPEQIQMEVYLGNPVVLFATLGWKNPVLTTYNVNGETHKWVSNNHVVVICGYDPENNRYYVADPWNKKNTRLPNKYWISEDTLLRTYAIRKQIIVVR